MRRQLAVLWLAVTLWLTGLVGLCLAQTTPSPPDIPYLTQQTQAGDSQAMIALGEAYLDGNGVGRDLDKAIGLFATVARNSNVEAIYLLSFALRERGKPGDLDEALRYGTMALTLVKRAAHSPFIEANIQSQLGFTYERLGRFEEAVKAYAAARQIFERGLGRNHPQVAGAYMNLASGLAGAGRQEESLAANETALALFIKLTGNDSEQVAELYENIGINLMDLARYSEALDALDKALAIFQKRGPDSPSVADVLKTKSRALTLLVRYQEAIAAAQSALAIYARSAASDQRTLAATHVNLGLAYQALERYAEAREQYLAAAKILENSSGANTVEMMHPLINLGNVDDELGNYEDALNSYRRALALIIAAYGPDHAEVATLLGRLGNTSRKLKRYDAALDYGLQALLIQSGAADPDIDSERYTFRLLARTLGAKGSKETAVFFAKQAVNAHQEVRSRNSNLPDELRAKLGQSFQPSYRLLSELLLADGQFSEAQFVSGLLKQEEFYEFAGSADRLSQEERNIEPGSIRLTKAEQRFWLDIRNLMAPVFALASDIRKLMADREATGTPSPEDQARLAELTGKRTEAMRVFVASALDLIGRTEAQRLLQQKEALDFDHRYEQKIAADLNAIGPGSVLLQITSLEDALYFSVSAGGHETMRRQVPVSRTELANKVSSAVDAIEERSDSARFELAQLYDILIKPVRPDLDAMVSDKGANAPVLLLDLSGFLRYVPYAALYDGRHYLVEDFAPTLYNPANPIKFTAIARKNIKGAGFGVTHEHPGFSALPGAARELAAVFAIVDGKPRLDEDFTEKTLAGALSPRTRILHIASHFRFRPGNELNSYLLLGNGDELTLNQLRTQKRFRFRDIDLITLSACETARGGGAEGEEIESFGSLAQSKGASAVMSTLWQIADESTARLMTDFYDGLVNQGLDKASALRRAQIAMIKGEAANAVALQASRAMTVIETASESADKVAPPTSHPYYWAAFILMGNWK